VKGQRQDSGDNDAGRGRGKNGSFLPVFFMDFVKNVPKCGILQARFRKPFQVEYNQENLIL
jgi:hypothetical protein